MDAPRSSDADESVRSDPTEPEGIDPVHVRIESADLEARFRASTRHEDGFRTIVGLSAVCLALIVFAYTDYLVLGASAAFVALLTLRATTVGVGVSIIRRVRTGADHETIDRAMLAWWTLTAVCLTVIDASRPPTRMTHIGIDARARF